MRNVVFLDLLYRFTSGEHTVSLGPVVVLLAQPQYSFGRSKKANTGKPRVVSVTRLSQNLKLSAGLINDFQKEVEAGEEGQREKNKIKSKTKNKP